jgi:solute carrier family 25 citrate transporter 1
LLQKESSVNYYLYNGFYRGYTALVFFSVPKNYVRFGTNSWVKKNIFQEKETRLNTFISGLTAGATEALFVVTPQETLKTKLIHDKLSDNPKYNGLFHGIRTIWANHGFNGIYKGALPTVLRQSTNQGTRFLVHGEVKKRLDSSVKSNMVKDFVSGGVAGIVSVLVNNPIDVCKTQLQGLQASKYNGLADCMVKTFNNEGFKGFYKGVTPRMMRVGLDVSLTFTIFHQMNDILINAYLRNTGKQH